MTSQADKNRANAFSRASVKASMSEIVGDTSIEYRLSDEGQVFHIPSPFFFDKETKEALKPLADDDEDGTAQVLLGDQYDAFVAEGGTGDDISSLLALVQVRGRKAMADASGPTKR